jgi:hypothetical protein
MPYDGSSCGFRIGANRMPYDGSFLFYFFKLSIESVGLAVLIANYRFD